MSLARKESGGGHFLKPLNKHFAHIRILMYNSNIMTYGFKKSPAFTLAEVLITIAIIGVVAAITVPTLIQNIQEKHFHAKWKECYSILNSAFKMMLYENPNIIVAKAGINGPTREFVDAFLTNINVIETCGRNQEWDNNVCDNYSHVNQNQIKYKWSGIAEVYSRYSTLAGSNLNSYDFNNKAALLKNGASIYFGGLWSGLTIVVDVNNFNNGPNVLGKDVYAISFLKLTGKNIYLNDLGFMPYGAEGTIGADNSSAGNSGCAADIGASPNSDGSVTTLYLAPGAGCSYKYLNEK